MNALKIPDALIHRKIHCKTHSLQIPRRDDDAVHVAVGEADVHSAAGMAELVEEFAAADAAFAAAVTGGPGLTIDGEKAVTGAVVDVGEGGVDVAFAIALESAGKRIAISSAMMPMTTSNSTSVNALDRRLMMHLNFVWRLPQALGRSPSPRRRWNNSSTRS